MRTVLIAILPLLVLGCAADHVGTAMEVRATSPTSQGRLWSAVDAAVRGFARERGFRLEASASDFRTYIVEAPNQPTAITIVAARRFDSATIDISEVGVGRPSREHRDIQSALKIRLEAGGLLVSRIKPTLVVTF